MTRSGWALAALLAAAGCGTVASVPSSLEGAPPSARARAREASREGTPEIVRVARPLLAVTYIPQRRRGIGYFWVGFTPADVPLEDLRHADSGDGFTFGVGLKFTETWRGSVELAFEKTVNHEYLFPDDGDTGTSEYDASPQTAYHARLLAGFRFGAISTRTDELQSLPYVSVGVSDTKFGVDRMQAEYKHNGFGFYAGFGVELPYADRASFGFDAKYHTWGAERFATAAFTILWLNRF